MEAGEGAGVGDGSGDTVLRAGALPLYHQLQHAMRTAIESGRWAPGQRLPGERELMRQYGVSRTTVREALEALERDGLVVRQQGRGTFVAPRPLIATLARLQGFTEELQALGRPVGVTVLHAGPVPAPPEAAEALQLEPGARVVEISRVVTLDGQPLFTDESFLLPGPGRLVLAAEPGQTIYAALEAVGFKPATGEQTIEAAPATRREAQHLGIRPGEPVLLIRRVTRMADGAPLEYRRVAYRGDRYRYRVALVRQPPGEPARA